MSFAHIDYELDKLDEPRPVKKKKKIVILSIEHDLNYLRNLLKNKRLRLSYVKKDVSTELQIIENLLKKF